MRRGASSEMIRSKEQCSHVVIEMDVHKDHDQISSPMTVLPKVMGCLLLAIILLYWGSVAFGPQKHNNTMVKLRYSPTEMAVKPSLKPIQMDTIVPFAVDTESPSLIEVSTVSDADHEEQLRAAHHVEEVDHHRNVVDHTNTGIFHDPSEGISKRVTEEKDVTGAPLNSSEVHLENVHASGEHADIFADEMMIAQHMEGIEHDHHDDHSMEHSIHEHRPVHEDEQDQNPPSAEKYLTEEPIHYRHHDDEEMVMGETHVNEHHINEEQEMMIMHQQAQHQMVYSEEDHDNNKRHAEERAQDDNELEKNEQFLQNQE